MERGMKITVVNRTKSEFKISLVVEATYPPHKLYKNDYRVFDFITSPIKRDYKIILEEVEEEWGG